MLCTGKEGLRGLQTTKSRCGRSCYYIPVVRLRHIVCMYVHVLRLFLLFSWYLAFTVLYGAYKSYACFYRPQRASSSALFVGYISLLSAGSQPPFFYSGAACRQNDPILTTHSTPEVSVTSCTYIYTFSRKTSLCTYLRRNFTVSSALLPATQSGQRSQTLRSPPTSPTSCQTQRKHTPQHTRRPSAVGRRGDRPWPSTTQRAGSGFEEPRRTLQPRRQFLDAWSVGTMAPGSSRAGGFAGRQAARSSAGGSGRGDRDGRPRGPSGWIRGACDRSPRKRCSHEHNRHGWSDPSTRCC